MATPYKILVVDDQPVIRQIARSTLACQGYDILEASNGEDALEIARDEMPACVLLDVRMPGISGLDVCRTLKSDPKTAHIKIVMLTGELLDEDREEGFKEGADEYFTKPFSPIQLLDKLRVLLGDPGDVEIGGHRPYGSSSGSGLTEGPKPFKRLAETFARRLRSAADLQQMERSQLTIYSSELGLLYQREVAKSQELQEALSRLEEAQKKLERAHEETILRLAMAAEYRDDDTATHIQRMSCYSEALARRMGLSPEEVITVKRASPMHDIGKIGIRDAILQKPGKYTPEEFDEMKQHTVIGARILTGSSSELLQMGEIIAMNHHEKWDGTGYPDSKFGADIPLVARLVSLADVFDALTTKRCYKPAFSVERAVDIINQGRGTHFDPDVAEAFVGILDEILTIKTRFKDPD